MKSKNQNPQLYLEKTTISKLDKWAAVQNQDPIMNTITGTNNTGSLINCGDTYTSCGLYFCDTTYLTI